MGQISIPMLNKVGYSMYWNSMWDNKINYTRSLKEDIYLQKFVNLIFNDCISSNVIKFYNKKYQKKILDIYKVPSSLKGRKELNNYLIKINKLTFYSSKVWILKYQKWIILYIYLYLPIFNKIKPKVIYSNSFSDDNFFNLYSFYKKSNSKLLFSYKFFKKQPNYLFF